MNRIASQGMVASPVMRPTSSSDNSVLPDDMKIRCHVGGEWKRTSEFSKSQVKKYDYKAKQGRATPTRSGISCRIHSGEQASELQCEGPCNQWKALHQFSRSTRRNGVNWCVSCTEWSQCNEPGKTPFAPPLSQLSPDEVVPYIGTYREPGDDMIFDRRSLLGLASTTEYGSACDDVQSLSVGTEYHHSPQSQFSELGAMRLSTASSMKKTATSSTATAQTAGKKGGWARPSRRKQPPQYPMYLKDSETLQAAQQTSWQNTTTYDDDGESPDEC